MAEFRLPLTLPQVIALVDAWAHEETAAMKADGVTRTQRTIHKELSGAYIDVLNLLRDIPVGSGQ